MEQGKSEGRERAPDASPSDSEPPRWRYRFHNLRRANARLQDAAARGIETLTLLEREGLIQRFEYSFELAWKTLKDVLEHDGVILDLATPREVIRKAAAAGHLTEQDLWMEMLADRRRTSHEYDEEHLTAVTASICRRYAGAIGSLVTSLAGRKNRAP